MTFQQTTTPLQPFYGYLKEWKSGLVKEMVGKKLNELRTPSLVIDKTVLERNCEKLSKITTDLNTKIRVHVKTHKTVEGARIQLERAKTDAIVVSTLAEAYAMVNSELTRNDLLKDVLVGFPITPDKLNDIVELSKHVNTIQIFIDNVVTLEALEAFCKDKQHQPFNVFLKVNCGYSRAGVPLDDIQSLELARRLQNSSHVNFKGIYTHAGHSYSSETPEDALRYLQDECDMARRFRDYFIEHGINIGYVSIGATPTVKSILAFPKTEMEKVLEGIDEVHAGAFAFLDKQQVATGLGDYRDVAIMVATRVVSHYADRNSILIDAGALAFSKDTAPQGGYGYIVDASSLQTDKVEFIASVNKLSQEHGLLQELAPSVLSNPQLEIGKVVRVIPNHCCLTAACHLFYLIIEDGNDTVVDVWVPIKGW